MKNKTMIAILIFLSAFSIFAQDETSHNALNEADETVIILDEFGEEIAPQTAAETTEEDVPQVAAEATEEENRQAAAGSEESTEIESTGTEVIAYNLLRNEYFLESLRQKNYARLAIGEGEYDKSAWHSSEAERYAQLSDDYIKNRLAKQRAQKELAAAGAHIAWAEKEQTEKYYPNELAAARGHYGDALTANKEEDWPLTLENAQAVQKDLYGVAAPPVAGRNPEGLPKTPSQYRVRPWDKFGDCLWNISKWFYGDYYRWPVLFEANREKLPEPDNPDLLEIGTVLDIPSLNGEKRVGVWDSGSPYKAN